MKRKVQTLLLLTLTSTLFVSCNVPQLVEDAAAKVEENQTTDEEKQDDYEEYDEFLADEIDEFIICVPEHGEIDVLLDQELDIEELSNDQVLEVRSEACGGDYSMVINGEEIDEDFDFVVEEKTTGEDLLEQLLDAELEEDCSDHKGEESTDQQE